MSESTGAGARARARALAIVGPTAAGKSALALRLAQQLQLPLLSCDSVQVYRGLDIGSAKASPAERERVRHELIDLVDPDQDFSADDYARLARAQLERGPGIVCGGTGLYLRAAGWSHSGTDSGRTDSGTGREAGPRSGDHAQAPLPDHGPERERFEARWMAEQARETGAIHAELARRDPDTAAAIHPNNVVRSLRALWLCERHRAPISEVRRRDPMRAVLDILMLVVDPGVAAVDAAIEARCEAMLTRGWVAEVEKLLAEGYDGRYKSMRSLGYREVLEYLQGRASLPQTKAAIIRATRKYARRQRTYFRHQFRQLLAMERIVTIAHPDACPTERVTAFLRGQSQ